VGGGAVYCSAGIPTLSSSIISGNVASNGGAIYTTASAPVIRNCTFTGNDATNGGAIYCYNSSNVTLENSILWADTADSAPEIFISRGGSGSSSTVWYCDVQGGPSAAVVQEGCTLNWGDENIDTDPCFVRPASWDTNGVLIEGDYHLLEDSLCINAGDPDFTVIPNETDIDGQPRVMEGRVDMSADEFSNTMILADLEIYPPTLNLASNARWIKCHIRLPEGYTVADIDTSSIVLEGDIEPQWLSVELLEQIVMVRFSRSDVQSILDIGLRELVVSGKLLDETPFQAADTIKVIDKGGKKK
jgi:predicted outer membrane repeat protein